MWCSSWSRCRSPRRSDAPRPPAAARRGRGRLWAGALVVAAALAWLAASRLTPRAELPRFKQLTYQRGVIYSARLAPDGQTVVYGADWGGRGLELFSTRPGATESRPTGEAGGHRGISRTGRDD